MTVLRIPKSAALPSPQGVPASPQTVAAGQLIPAIERVRLFSDRQWEEFILEWADSLRKKYRVVERCGGAGDMGRDVIASRQDGTWDNYQCKHYDHALYPGDVWLEIGKLVYYTAKGAYSVPRAYYFVAPQGVGTTLSNLLRSPDALKKNMKAKWKTQCEDKITSTGKVVLDEALNAHLDSINFSIFRYVPPLRILDAHRQTPWHVARFGGGLPNRPSVPKPPPSPLVSEAEYVRQILYAYAEYLGKKIPSPSSLIAEAESLRAHFDAARREFYSAESLREFSRDRLPAGTFEALQEEIQAGIMDEHRAEHDDGYRRLLAVVRAARMLPITGHPLVTQLHIRDRGGVCHQLVNDRKLRWIVP